MITIQRKVVILVELKIMAFYSINWPSVLSEKPYDVTFSVTDDIHVAGTPLGLCETKASKSNGSKTTSGEGKLK